MKRLSGKRWFYALGQRSLHVHTYNGPMPTMDWPKWAREAFFKGHEDERWSSVIQTVKTWPASKLAEAAQ